MSDRAILLTAALAAAWVCVLEAKRPDRRRLAARVAASLAALGSLAALALEPALPRRVADARAVLVTEGASWAFAREIADSAGARRVLSLGNSISDLAALRRHYPDVGEVVVAGWGLPAEELSRAGDLDISFAPAPLPVGIRSVAWPSRVVLGEEVLIRGEATPADWVHLGVHGREADSSKADADGRFSLRFMPRAAGLRTFELRSGGTVDTGAVDVRTRAPAPVLLIEGTPGFELTHLRRWLAQQGGKVGARTTVSRGRARTLALNGAPTPGRVLSSEILRAFDLVVLDGSAASALSPREVDVLREAIREEGLGLLLVGGGVRIAGLLVPDTRSGSAQRTIRVRRSGSAELSPPVTGEAWTPIPGDAGAVILEDTRGGAIATWEASGAGRIGLTAVRNPSRWLLEGDQAAYDRYWSAILASLERPRPGWHPPAALPAETDHPISLAWTGPIDSVVVSGGPEVDTLFPKPDPDSLAWSAIWWPRSPGEFRAEGPGDTLRFRAAASGSWRVARAAERMRATKLHAALHFSEASRADSVTTAPIPPWTFMVLFTGAAGWLWWERRRSGPS